VAKISPNDYRTISEFPEWEINVEGVIRHKWTGVRRYPHDSASGPVVKFTKEGKRYLRTVEKLRRVAFSVPVGSY
jgi:hypothetical protein